MAFDNSQQGSVFNSRRDGDDSRVFKRVDIRRDDPELKAIVDKLVAPLEKHGQQRVGANREIKAPDSSLIQRISDETAQNLNDATSMMQLLPDLELAKLILVSTILSPKDMGKVELNFSVDSNVFKNELSGMMLECIRHHFENVYKISDNLTTILEDVLFDKGSHPVLILPESSIDDLINSPSRVTMESISDDIDVRTNRVRSKGLLGNKAAEGTAEQTFSFENMVNIDLRAPPSYICDVPALKIGKGEFDPYLTIVDNVTAIKVPMLVQKIRSDNIRDLVGIQHPKRGMAVSVEQEQKPANTTSYYRSRRYKNIPVGSITPASQIKRKSVGNPLIMPLPSECVIPVHVPSNPKEHLGYFILLDQQGNPLIKATESDYYTDLQSQINVNNEMVSQLLAQTNRNEVGYKHNGGLRESDVEEMSRIYSDLVEKELEARLKNGIYQENVAVSKPQEIYRIMLARALSKQRTQLLYVPAEMMTYFAFDYNQNGVGKSLLQGTKVIGGLRAMLLFANTMASIKNSVGRTQLNITLDPNDPDPSTTVEFLLNEYARTTQSSFPLGASSPRELISFLQNAGVEVSVSGNLAYPETKIEVQDVQSNRAKPDAELEKSLRDRQIMGIGLSPESIDASSGADFAATVVQNSLLLTKRVLRWQEKLVVQVEDHARKYALYSSELWEALLDILRNNKDKLDSPEGEESQRPKERQNVDARSPESGRAPSVENRGNEETDQDASDAQFETMIVDFLHALRVSLPSPDVATLASKMKAYDEYVEGLDKAISAYIDASFLGEIEVGNMKEAIDSTKAAVRAHFIRRWLRDNNVFTELEELTTLTEDGTAAMDLMDVNSTHVEGLSKAIGAFMKKVSPVRKESDAVFEETKPEGALGGSSFGSPDSGLDTADDSFSETGDTTELSTDDSVVDSDGTDDTDTSDDDKEKETTDDSEKKDPKDDDIESLAQVPDLS